MVRLGTAWHLQPAPDACHAVAPQQRRGAPPPPPPSPEEMEQPEMDDYPDLDFHIKDEVQTTSPRTM